MAASEGPGDSFDALRRAEGESVSGWAYRLIADQSRRWNAGECLRVEQYRDGVPGLRQEPAALLELIANEIHLRHEGGERASAQEYINRFPELDAQELRCQVQAVDVLTQPAEPDSHLPPQVPSRFRLLRCLGRGGFGEVWEAEDNELGRRVAIKFLLGNRLDPEVLARFMIEAQAAARANHPHVCHIYDVVAGNSGHPPFLVLEFVAGQTLRTRLAVGTGQLQVEESIRIAIDAARGLHHLHERRIIHRDFKPENVMFNEEGVLKILDLGLARQAQRIAPGLTPDGAIVGTWAYCSPEQLRADADAVGPCSDQFSLGVVLYEMLTGRRPFGGDIVELLRAIRDEEPPSLRAARPEVDAALEAICLRTLAKDPEQRYPSLEHLADALEAYRAGSPPSPPHRPRAWPARVALSLLAVLLALGLGVFYWNPTPSAPKRVRLGIDHVLNAVHRDLGRCTAAERLSRRYLRLDHLYNDPQRTGAEIDRVRRAILTAVRSLHDKEQFTPEWVDEQQTVLALDLDRLGWPWQNAEDGWSRLIAACPYGLRYDDADSLSGELQKTARKVQASLGGRRVFLLPADWFVATALQQPYASGLLGRQPEALKDPADAEAVEAVARRYLDDPVDAETAARELGVDDPEKVRALIRDTPYLHDDWKLAPLAGGRSVSRAVWAQNDLERSPFRETARLLMVGHSIRNP